MKSVLSLILIIFVLQANHPLITMAQKKYSLTAQSLSSSADNPDDRVSLLLKARAYYLNEQYSKAISCYSDIIAQNATLEPAYTKAHFGIAESYASLKQFQEAEEFYHTALKTLTSKEMKEHIALEYIDEARKIFDDSSNVALNAALAYLNIAQTVVECGNLYEEAAFLMADMPYYKEKYRDAFYSFHEFTETYPQSPFYFEALYKGAFSANEINRKEEVRLKLTRIISECTNDSLRSESLLLLAKSCNMPTPQSSEELYRGIDALSMFIEQFPNHPAIDQARYEIAISSLSNATPRPTITDSLVSYYLPYAKSENRRAEAVFKKALSHAFQGKVSEALNEFEAFIRNYPYSEQTQQAHKEIENIWWDQGAQAFGNNEWHTAITHFTEYIAKYPERERSGEAHFRIAQSWLKLSDETKAREYFQITSTKFHAEEWGKKSYYQLAALKLAKDPSSKEVYTFLEKNRNNLDRKAAAILDEWGDTLLQILPSTPFLSNESPFLITRLRNIDSVRVSLYEINEEHYFRDQLSMKNISQIAIDLCKPQIENIYLPEKPNTKTIITEEIPLPIKKAGIYLIKLTTGNREAVTSLCVSDIRAIMKKTANGSLLFVENVKTGKPGSGAKVLIADEEKRVHEARTDNQGVYRSTIPTSDYTTFIKLNDHVTWITPENGVIKSVEKDSAYIQIITDKGKYTKSDSVKIMIPPLNVNCRLSVEDSTGRVIFESLLPSSNAVNHLILPPHRHRRGSYQIALRDSSDKIYSSETYEVVNNEPVHKTDLYQLTSEIKDSVFYRGDTIEIALKLTSESGMEIENQLIKIESYNPAIEPDTVFTDVNGEAVYSLPINFFIEKSGLTEIAVTAPSHFIGHYERVHLLKDLFSLKSSVPNGTIYPNETFKLLITGKSKIHEGITKQATLKLFKKTERGETAVSSRQIDIAIDTVTEIELKTETVGTFRAEITYRDGKNSIFTETQFFVSPNDPEKEFMKITLDDSIYTPGESISASIESNISGHILFTFESDSIVEYHIHKAVKGRETITLPVKNSMVPNITVSAAAVVDRKLATFTKEITVSKELKITIDTAESIKAGDTLTLRISIGDAKKRNKNAAVSLFITENQSGKRLPHAIYDNYYSRNSHAVTTRNSNIFLTRGAIAETSDSMKIIESDEIAGMSEFRSIRKKITKLAKEEYASGIGFGSGTGEGFSGSSGGVDDLLGSLMGGGGSNIELRKRSSLAHSKQMGTTSWTATSIATVSNKYTDENGALTVKVFIPDSIRNSIVVNALAVAENGYIGSLNRLFSVKNSSKRKELPIVEESEELTTFSFSVGNNGDSVYSDIHSFIKALPLNLSLYREHPLYSIYLKNSEGNPDEISSSITALLTGGTEPLLSSKLTDNRENFITALPLLLDGVDKFTPWIHKEELTKLLPQIVNSIKDEEDTYLRLKLLLAAARIDHSSVPTVTLQRLDRMEERLDMKSKAILAQLWHTLGRPEKSRNIAAEVTAHLEKAVENSTIPDADELINSLELILFQRENNDLLIKGAERLVIDVLPKILNAPNRMASAIELLSSIYNEKEETFSITKKIKLNNEGNKRVTVKRQFIPFDITYMGRNLYPLSALFENRNDTTIDADSLNQYDFLAVKITVNDSKKETIALTEKIPHGFSYVTSLLKSGFYSEKTRELSYFCASNDTLIYIVKAETEGNIAFMPTALYQQEHWRSGNSRTVAVVAQEERIHYRDLPQVSEKRGDIARLNGNIAEAVSHYEKAAAKIESRELKKKLLFTSIELKDNNRIVNYFEETRERYPNLVIPFDKLETIRHAYHEMELFESGLNLNRGIAESRFLQELNIVGKLESIAQKKSIQSITAPPKLNSLPAIKRITTAYPYSEHHAKALYLFAHLLYDRIDKEKMSNERRTELLNEIELLLSHYLGEYQKNSERDAAVYTRASASLDRNDFRSAVTWCEIDSTSAYVTALNAYASFLDSDNRRALDVASALIDSSDDTEFVNALGKYVLAQVYHTTGDLSKALGLYREVAHIFDDARTIIENSSKRTLTVSENILLKPAETAIPLTLINIDTVTISSYPIDLPAFLQREGTLQTAESINLSGIRPAYVAKHYPPRKMGIEQKLHLDSGIKKNGAYLSFIQAGDLTLTTLVIKSDIEVSVQHNSDVGVQICAISGGKALADAAVLIKGNSPCLIRGRSDARGVFNFKDHSGEVTVIVQKDDNLGIYLEKSNIKTVTKAPTMKNEKRCTYKNPGDFFSVERNKKGKERGSFFNQNIEGVMMNQILN